MEDSHTTTPTPTTAHAFLGVAGGAHHTFRFNPDSASWAYQENTNSQDTIGGRVVQLLSVQVQGVTIQGRAGSRGELQRLAENTRQIMEYHVKTLRPVSFKVPSRRWNFRVYVQAMPQMGWDVSATSYPYSLQLQVEEDLTGIQSKKLETAALNRLVEGIGYNKAVHGGDVAAFDTIVKSVTSASPTTTSGGGGGGGGDSGGSGGTTPAGIPLTTVKFQHDIFQQFPNASFMGICSCRHIIPHDGGTSSIWSEHSWGNAIDVGGSATLMNQIMAWAQRNKAHYSINNIIGPGSAVNCVHVDFFPSHAGQTPPCAHGGPPCN